MGSCSIAKVTRFPHLVFIFYVQCTSKKSQQTKKIAPSKPRCGKSFRYLSHTPFFILFVSRTTKCSYMPSGNSFVDQALLKFFKGWYQYIHRLAWCCWHYNSYMKLKNAATHRKIPFIFQIASRMVDCVCTFLHVKILKAMEMKTMAGVPVCNCMHVYVLCCWFHSLHSTQNTRKTFNKTFKKTMRKTTAWFPRKTVFSLVCWMLVCPSLIYRFNIECAHSYFKVFTIHQTTLYTAIFYSSLLIAFPVFSWNHRHEKNQHGNFFLSSLLCVCAISIHFIYSYMANVI